LRTGLLCLGLALCVALYEGWLAQVYDHVTTAALSDDARTAIEIRCSIQEERAARECQSTLKKLYLSGSLDPDKTLRAWCDSVKTGGYGGQRPRPPALCVARYGGWEGS